jgi:hypothetical protein
MLNLLIAMRPRISLFILLIGVGFWIAQPVKAADVFGISQPVGGAALQGQIAILGTSNMADFASFEVSFLYSRDAGKTWFLIRYDTVPVTGGVLANWDTTTITDGNYDLHLVVTLKDGTKKSADVKGLRVRNYSPVETATPTITPTYFTVVPTITPTPTPSPTRVRLQSTRLPTNPAAINSSEIDTTLLRGIGSVFLFFCAIGLYLWVRSRIMNR